MPLHIAVDRQALTNLGAPPSGPVYRHWMHLAAKIDTVAKRKLSGDLVNVRTGNLRSSQQMPTVVVHGSGRIIASVVNTASYAVFVHEGTRPHEIRPRTKKYLTGWSYAGAPVFTKLVHHPGTKARPWLREALTEVIHTTT